MRPCIPEIVYGFGDIVQMVVEQAAFVGGFRFDPAPAGEVDGVYSFLRHSVDEGIGVEAEVDCIRVQVMQVEEQVAVCHSENFAGPIRLAQLARGRIDQVATFSTSGIVPTIFLAAIRFTRRLRSLPRFLAVRRDDRSPVHRL